MRSPSRTLALAGALVLGAGLGLGAPTARAQGQVYYGGRGYTAPYAGASPYSYYAPQQMQTYNRGYGYSGRGGYYAPMQGYNRSGYSSQYGYGPARRELKMYKPWLRRR